MATFLSGASPSARTAVRMPHLSPLAKRLDSRIVISGGELAHYCCPRHVDREPLWTLETTLQDPSLSRNPAVYAIFLDGNEVTR